MEAIDVDLLYLDESQNEAFDYEYHCPAELDDKFAYLKARFPDGPKSILDIGGGNGTFVDAMLGAFPHARGTILDVSQNLLARNQPNPRKRLVLGSVANVQTLVGSEKFDVITINWVLHHLVAPSYSGSVANARTTLKALTDLLTPDGKLLVAENEFNGVFGSNLPSYLIYAITRVQTPMLVRTVQRFFNTAGVGVCFQSRRAWLRIFGASELTVDHYFPYDRWHHGLKRRLAFAGLFLAEEIHGHFALTRSGP